MSREKREGSWPSLWLILLIVAAFVAILAFTSQGDSCGPSQDAVPLNLEC